ncbi:IclR family transcriptional regulator [Micromonospora sp. NPDC005113]
MSAADREMQAIVRQHGETVYLTRYLPAAREAVFVHVVESETPLRYVLPLGLRIPLHAGAAGKAILAHLDDDVVDELRLARFTDRTIVKKYQLRAELALIRERGYAVSSGERIEGATGIAAAYWHNGLLVGSITMTVPQQNLDDHRLAALGSAARKAAETISTPFSQETG